MASLLESLEHHYTSLTAEVAVKLSEIHSCNPEEKRRVILETERQLEEVREVLEQIDLEVKGMPPATREKDMLPYRVKTYNSELSDLEKELKKAKQSARNTDFSRDELFESDYNRDERQCLLDNTERLESSSRHLEGGYKIALETEEIGAQILSDLHNQRETIGRTKERLQETNYDLGRSSRLASAMLRGLLQQRVLVSIAGIAVLVTIIVGIYMLASKS